MSNIKSTIIQIVEKVRTVRSEIGAYSSHLSSLLSFSEHDRGKQNSVVAFLVQLNDGSVVLVKEDDVDECMRVNEISFNSWNFAADHYYESPQDALNWINEHQY